MVELIIKWFDWLYELGNRKDLIAIRLRYCTVSAFGRSGSDRAGA
ncbi:hypothetical protein ACLB1M_30065 [Escherichia coli]